MNKLFCTFTTQEEVEALVEEIFSKYNVSGNKVFILTIDGSSELLATYNVEAPVGALLGSTFVANRNKATNTIYTINSLNSLIMEITGHLDKTYRINWDDYRNKVVLTGAGGIGVRKLESKIYRIFSK